MRSYQLWLDNLNQEPRRVPFAWSNVWHWHNFWPLFFAALFALGVVVSIVGMVVTAVDARKEKHSHGKSHATGRETVAFLLVVLVMLAGIFAVASGSFVYSAGTPQAPSQTVSFVQYVEHETGVAGLSCPRLDPMDAKTAPNGGWYQCKTGNDTEPLLLYVDKQAHAFSLQGHAPGVNQPVNPVNLDNYQPIEETATYSPSGWHVALFVLAVVVCVSSIIAYVLCDSDAAGVVAGLMGGLGVVVAAMSGMVLLLPTSHQYDVIPLTGVVEQESHVTNLQCTGLDDVTPSVEQYKRTGEQPWPATSDTMFSCTWQAGGEQVKGKLKLIPKQSYEGTSFIHESGSIYANGLHEGQLLTMDNTIWTPTTKEAS